MKNERFSEMYDSANERLVPRNVEQWLRLYAPCGRPIVWEAQEASGSIVDSIGVKGRP